MSENSHSYESIQRSLKLPCGVTLKNRLAKSAMSDSLGDGEGNPTEAQIRLYEKWAEGGVSLSFIGEVQTDYRYPEKPGNLVFDENSDLSLLSEFAKRTTIDGAHIWPQIGHAGALSHLPISNPKGPSAIDIDGLKCAELSLCEIKALPTMYAKSALLAKNAGFSGVHIHAGHGFLLSQFLSPLFNFRKDAYGGPVEARAKIVIDIIEKVRMAVGDLFPIGIRINSSDQLDGGLTENEALDVIRLLNKTSVDLIDISGGTYFPGAKASSESSANDVYFLNFARSARNYTDIPLMLTGGFKNRKQAIEALEVGAADIIGLGRAMILNPQLPKSWFSESGRDPEFPRFDLQIPGGVTAWYTMKMSAIAEEMKHEFSLDLKSAVLAYEERDSKKSATWKKKYIDDHIY